MVATPIGNLADFSFRAQSTLAEVDLILAEDTRESRKLLQHYGLQKPLLSVHQHNETQRIQQILSALKQGQHVALISDAGTPIISDPGYILVRAAREEGICVRPIPGACAVTAALSVCGLPCHPFVFLGFIPSLNSARIRVLEEIKVQRYASVFFETARRLVQTLKIAADLWSPSRRLYIGRELTKAYETHYWGDLTAVTEQLGHYPLKGELVVVVEGSLLGDQTQEQDAQELLVTLCQELPASRAVQLVQKMYPQVAKNKLYSWSLELVK